MLDSIVLTLDQRHFEVLLPERFSRSAQGLLMPPYYPLGSRGKFACVQNPTKKQLRAGHYEPRLTLSKQKIFNGFAMTLRIEFPAPKLVFGNNFDELETCKQTGLGGGLIDVTPWAVLVPSEWETDTEKLLSTIQATSTDDVNPFASCLSSSSRGLRTLTAGTWSPIRPPPTAWSTPTCRGAPGPQTESRAGFEVHGAQIKVRLDFGAGFIDHRGWYTNAGH